MDIADFQSLLTPEGQSVLSVIANENPIEKEFLSLFQKFSKQYPKEIVRAALTISILRGEAVTKFPFAEKLFLTREALQQSSSWVISKHRADRFKGFDHILDLGCSVGSDSFALAEIAPTTGYDRDPIRIAMAKANAQSLGLQATFKEQDILDLDPKIFSNSNTAIFIDPARRSNYKRAYHVENYSPPLSLIKKWLPIIPDIGVKISPGVKIKQLAEYDCEIEFISLKGELKEAVLWFGALKKNARQATLLPSGAILNHIPPKSLPITPPLKYIYEPDPAIIRSGLVTLVGEQIQANLIDERIAYLTNQVGSDTPFARKWEIESWLPFQLKRLRSHLRNLGVGRLTVKKRGSPIEPQMLIKQMKLSGLQERVIFLTKHNNKPIVVVAFPR